MTSGTVVGGKYRLVRLLGSGGMGEVWEAVNELTLGNVALKLLRQPSAEHRERMFREARACAKLTHKNVIAVHDVGQTDEGEPFLVMQLLSGETLAEHLERTLRLSPRYAAQIARDVARGLAAAHKAGVIHRDLKPANIFLHREEGSEDAVVKVLDFGVSKSLDRSELTRHGVAVGSPAYMSPEQAGASPRLDHRTDLWSLGVVLFQLLAGKKPFEGDALQLFVKILTEPIPLVSQFVRNVDPALVAVVSRCLERDPARRFGSAEELAAILDRFAQQSERVASAPEGPPQLLAPPSPAATLALPPELQTISSWTVPEPEPAAAASPMSSITDKAEDDDEATQQYMPHLLRAMARFPAEPPPLPPALPTRIDETLPCFQGAPRPARPAAPALAEIGSESTALPRLRETVRMSPAESLAHLPTYSANAVVPPRLPPAPSRGAALTLIEGVRPIIAVTAVACAFALGLTGVVVHYAWDAPQPPAVTSAAPEMAPRIVESAPSVPVEPAPPIASTEPSPPPIVSTEPSPPPIVSTEPSPPPKPPPPISKPPPATKPAPGRSTMPPWALRSGRR